LFAVKSAALQMRNSHFRQLGLLGALLLAAIPGHAQQMDLTDKSLEDLMNIKVTSVARTEQSLSHSAAAVFVITAADIRHSGATTIPDLLRMVPGMDVAQINANTWAISARGLNDRFSNELLVLVDGRNVYTPTFGGVFWDVLDVPLEDIARIEVIRGPGGSVWGANAVNGVVNIVTKKAAETQGGMLVIGGGNLNQGFATLQYGSHLGKNTDYRIYSRYFNQSHLPTTSGTNGDDAWRLLRGGFRSDTTLSSHDTLTFSGDIYGGNEDDLTGILLSVTSPVEQLFSTQTGLAGGFVQSVWNHKYSDRSDTSLQISFDRYRRDDSLGEVRKSFNIEFQHHLRWGTRQDIVWGLQYRNTDSDTIGDLTASLNPSDVNMQIFGAFVQDEIALLPDKLFLTIGTKLEDDYYVGFTPMPSGRLAWTPDKHHMLWAAVSRAERTPAETDTATRENFGGFINSSGTPVLTALIGNPNFKSEGLTAYEFGYRTRVSDHLSLDLATFYNDYDHQQTTEPAAPFFETVPAPAHLVLPMTYQNLQYGEAHGLEVWVNWKVMDRWTLSPGYAFEAVHMHVQPASQDTETNADTEGSSPKHSAQLRSHLDFGRGFSWDAAAYFVDRLSSLNVPSYTRVDSGFTWRLSEGLSASVVGQNLVQDRHLEFVDDTEVLASTMARRSVYGKLTWQF